MALREPEDPEPPGGIALERGAHLDAV